MVEFGVFILPDAGLSIGLCIPSRGISFTSVLPKPGLGPAGGVLTVVKPPSLVRVTPSKFLFRRGPLL